MLSAKALPVCNLFMFIRKGWARISKDRAINVPERMNRECLANESLVWSEKDSELLNIHLMKNKPPDKTQEGWASF